ncbi:hypothetical protein ACZ90_34000 [Streptomyces albus subsp. albus]|nr:hypothetical protein ACZ90_34000 [Streptomyces albus subsp. albus]
MTGAEPGVLRPLGPDDPREIAGYQLLAKVGEGGMGAVYLTRTRGRQPVALKVIRREFARNPDFRARFEQEVQAARRVSGYHIVPVLDHDVSGEEPWIATAYVPGLPLDDALTGHGPLPLPATLQLIGCTAQALHSVHSASVIHRDLKPSNILLGSDGPWVIDFGIARAADSSQLTQTGGFIGTPQYMSPEHALGRKVTAATDIFALGLIAAVVATGRHPYGDASGLSIAALIANTEQMPPDLSGYPAPLRPLLEACLAADPAARPAPAALADWCRQASGRELRDFTDWLPQQIAKEIVRREEAAAQPPAAQPPAGRAPDPTAGSGFGPTYPATQMADSGGYPPTQAAPAGPGPYGPGAPAGPGGYGPAQSAATPGPGQGFASAAQPPAAPGPGQGFAPAAGYAPPAQTAAPTPAGPAAGGTGRGRSGARRGRSPMPIVLGGVLAAALIGGGIWVFSQSGEKDPAKQHGQASPSPNSSSRGTTTAATDYEEISQGVKLTLDYPPSTTGSRATDLDGPRQEKGVANEQLVNNFDMELKMEHNLLSTNTSFSRALSADPKLCAAAARKNELAHRLGPAELNGPDALIGKGELLCTVTTKGNLALLKITDVKPYVRDPEWPDLHNGPHIPTYEAELTVWKPKG